MIIVEVRFADTEGDFLTVTLSGKHLYTGDLDRHRDYINGFIEAAHILQNDVRVMRYSRDGKLRVDMTHLHKPGENKLNYIDNMEGKQCKFRTLSKNEQWTDKTKLARLRSKALELYSQYGDPDQPVEFEDLADLMNLVLELTEK